MARLFEKLAGQVAKAKQTLENKKAKRSYVGGKRIMQNAVVYNTDGTIASKETLEVVINPHIKDLYSYTRNVPDDFIILHISKQPGGTGKTEKIFKVQTIVNDSVIEIDDETNESQQVARILTLSNTSITKTNALMNVYYHEYNSPTQELVEDDYPVVIIRIKVLPNGKHGACRVQSFTSYVLISKNHDIVFDARPGTASEYKLKKTPPMTKNKVQIPMNIDTEVGATYLGTRRGPYQVAVPTSSVSEELPKIPKNVYMPYGRSLYKINNKDYTLPSERKKNEKPAETVGKIDYETIYPQDVPPLEIDRFVKESNYDVRPLNIPEDVSRVRALDNKQYTITTPTGSMYDIGPVKLKKETKRYDKRGI